MVNQNGETVTEMDYSDKIYVADFLYNLSKYLPNDDRKYVVPTRKIKRR